MELLYQTLEIGVLFVLGYVLFYRKPKRKKRHACVATLLSKRCTHLQESLISCPKIEILYEFIFQMEGREKSFEVSSYEYDCVEAGVTATLVYEGCKLIAFGDFIKEFHLEE